MIQTDKPVLTLAPEKESSPDLKMALLCRLENIYDVYNRKMKRYVAHIVL